MKNFFRHHFFVLTFASLLLVVTGYSFTAHAQTTCHLYDSSTPVSTFSTGFAVPWNVLSSAKELLLKVTCLGHDSMDVTVGTGNELQYIYNQGYYYTDKWNKFTYDCENGATPLNGAWCVGKADSSVSLDLTQNRFVVSYVCTWTGSTWKCGCRDAVCSGSTGNMWQLQGVAKQQSNPAPKADTGGIYTILQRNLKYEWNNGYVVGPSFENYLDKISQLDHIKGIQYYISWESLQSVGPNTIDGDILTRLIEIPARYGKKASFSFYLHTFAPQWIKTNLKNQESTCDCPLVYTFEHIHPSVGVIQDNPIPFSLLYQAHADKFISLVANHIKNTTINGQSASKYIHYIAISGPSSHFGVETNFPVKQMTTENSNKLQFTHNKFVDGWKKAIDSYFSAFAGTSVPLQLGLHHDITVDGITFTDPANILAAQQIRDYYIQKSQQNGTPAYLKLLGLGNNTTNYFGNTNSAYLSLVKDKRSSVKIIYESARVNSLPQPALGFGAMTPQELEDEVLAPGVREHAMWIEIKHPDVLDFADKTTQLYQSMLEKYSLTLQN